MTVPIEECWLDHTYNPAVSTYNFYGVTEPEYVYVYKWMGTDASSPRLLLGLDFNVAIPLDKQSSTVTLTPAGHAKMAGHGPMRFVRAPEFIQPWNYAEKDKFPSKSHERGLDYLEHQIQYLLYLITQSGTLGQGEQGPQGIPGPPGPPVAAYYDAQLFAATPPDPNQRILQYICLGPARLKADTDGTVGPVRIFYQTGPLLGQTVDRWVIGKVAANGTGDTVIGHVSIPAVASGAAQGVANIPADVDFAAGDIVYVRSPASVDPSGSGITIGVRMERL